MNKTCKASIERLTDSGIYQTILNRGEIRELFLTVWPLPDEKPADMCKRLGKAVKDSKATIISQKMFHFSEAREECLNAMEKEFGHLDWPLTWLEEEMNGHPRLAGTVIHAIAGPRIETVEQDGRVVGCRYSEKGAEHLVMGDLRDPDTSKSAAEQTQYVLESMIQGLAAADMDFSHVIRTWFWNHDILGWYDEFNQVRTDFYEKYDVFNNLLPASTGIGAQNPFGAALTAGLIATKRLDDSITAQAVTSPLQSSARDYGSSFSRASEIAMADHRKLFISGTASIDKAGLTVHVDDVAAQVDLTMRVVEEILKSRDMDWSDISRGMAYFRNAKDAPEYDKYCEKHSLPKLPVIVTNNVVCRDDLLYEIEVDAIALK